MTNKAFAVTDFSSIHTPLTPQCRHFIGKITAKEVKGCVGRNCSNLICRIRLSAPVATKQISFRPYAADQRYSFSITVNFKYSVSALTYFHSVIAIHHIGLWCVTLSYLS